MSTCLTPGQIMIIRDLVGERIASEDMPALELAFRDFQAGMDSLKTAFAQRISAAELAVDHEQGVAL
ncbi:hypothetical protein AB6813_00625 [bacterium RCC_150]